jgi:hypothetical protein
MFASLKLNVTGNVKDAPEPTIVGRDEISHWNVERHNGTACDRHSSVRFATDLNSRGLGGEH